MVSTEEERKAQMSAYRKPGVSTSTNNEDIIHYSLSGLLEDDEQLAVNLQTRTISLLTIRNDKAALAEQQTFTTGEMYVLLPLLASYPYFCGYDTLLASFNTGRTTEKDVERAHKRLQYALDEGTWDQEMRPARNVLSRARLKFRAFGIEIMSILATGYMLVSFSPAKNDD
jgi:hypothetical protein